MKVNKLFTIDLKLRYNPVIVRTIVEHDVAQFYKLIQYMHKIDNLFQSNVA